MTHEVPARAPHGVDLHCASWQLEAPYRMLLNNLDADVAEDRERLIVYGGTGRAARSWDCVRAILRTLCEMTDEETLLVQSGKPVGVVSTHPGAPRVLIANSNLVPRWATQDEFRRLEAAGLIMYGQMTAGSWIYIGTQGILQGTYETFAAAAVQHFDGSLVGRFVLTSGLGGMGGAQPLAATMNGAVLLGVDVDPERVRRRVDTGYCDAMETDLDVALARVDEACRARQPFSMGLVGNAADVLPELVRRGVTPDLVTDQTSAHDPLNGYVPNGMSLEEAVVLRGKDPAEYLRRSRAAIAAHCRAILDMRKAGAVAFDYGNNLRGEAREAGVEDAFDYPGFVPAYVRPLFCSGKGPFRWAALSGDPADIAATDRAVLDLFPEDEALGRWIRLASEKVRFQGLPSRICWLGYGERARFGERIHEMVKNGELRAPIVIGRDHLDCGSVASPFRETEGMRDGSDAIADWPILNALVNAACGATWVSFHHGGGVGIGNSLHAGMVVCADGTDLSLQKLRRVLTNDPGMGILRHVDAGYPEAVDFAKAHGVKAPLLREGEAAGPPPGVS